MKKTPNSSSTPFTHYDLLQIKRTADFGVISGAYKALIRMRHEDCKNLPGYVGSDLVYKLNEAKEVLLDPIKRAAYDRTLDEKITTLGNYEVIRVIGQGEFSRTYEGRHILLGERACLKQNINISPEDNLFLVNEAKLLWNIHHHSLPTLRDFFKLEDGGVVLAMSYVDGKTLDSLVKEKGPIDPEHVCWITQRTLNALHYLHFHGIIHGDIKPANLIILPEEHNAVLVDYGFSLNKPSNRSEPKGYTPAFASPEIFAMQPPRPESDLYSLGCTMIYALGGNPVSKIYPKNVPKPIKDYFDQFVLHDQHNRPNWQKCDLVKILSDTRQSVFGRRQSDKKLEA